jgi:hypothetical protein
MSFFGQIDPYARAEVRGEAGDELEEDGTCSFSFELAEANLTLMAKARPDARPLGIPQRVPSARPAVHRQS